MIFKFKNLGPLHQAELELGGLTAVCGENNTGKTYAAYAIYGFLSFWESYTIPVDCFNISELQSIDIADFRLKLLRYAGDEYKKNISDVFAVGNDNFEKINFEVFVKDEEYPETGGIQFVVKDEKKILNTKAKYEANGNVLKSIFVKDDFNKETIISGLKARAFLGVFPDPFIISAERTGVLIFREELDFARNKLLESISGQGANLQSARNILSDFKSKYPAPVQANVDFHRRLESMTKRKSFIAREHPAILNDFADIIGGDYNVSGGAVRFAPKDGGGINLTMDASSSAVRAMLDLGLYLRHVAEPWHILIIDEPEMNLHPENQRRIARLFARLVNLGLKVFITTHSDYIIKELSTLIMLNGISSSPEAEKIQKKYCFKKEELISPDKIRVYIAGPEKSSKKSNGGMTLRPAKIDSEYGIEAESFNKTINQMNEIQDAIIFSGE